LDDEAFNACILERLRGQFQVANVLRLPNFASGPVYNRKSIRGLDGPTLVTSGTALSNELDTDLEPVNGPSWINWLQPFHIDHDSRLGKTEL
jgi:hypothetical protein